MYVEVYLCVFLVPFVDLVFFNNTPCITFKLLSMEIIKVCEELTHIVMLSNITQIYEIAFYILISS